MENREPSLPFDKKTVPVTEAELRHFRKQYTILLVLPVVFIGLFCVTAYFNPPSKPLDYFYAAVMAVAIVASILYILKRRRATDVQKLVIRGVVSDKAQKGKGGKASYFLFLGEERIRVPPLDYHQYEPGDVVTIELLDDFLLRKPTITLLGKVKPES